MPLSTCALQHSLWITVTVLFEIYCSHFVDGQTMQKRKCTSGDLFHFGVYKTTKVTSVDADDRDISNSAEAADAVESETQTDTNVSVALHQDALDGDELFELH